MGRAEAPQRSEGCLWRRMVVVNKGFTQDFFFYHPGCRQHFTRSLFHWELPESGQPGIINGGEATGWNQNPGKEGRLCKPPFGPLLKTAEPTPSQRPVLPRSMPHFLLQMLHQNEFELWGV